MKLARLSIVSSLLLLLAISTAAQSARITAAEAKVQRRYRSEGRGGNRHLLCCNSDDDSLIDKHLLPLLQAEETKFFTLPVGRGKNRTLQIHKRNTVAWNARKEGLDMALKIRGLYVREQENKGPDFSVVMIDASHRPDWGAMRRVQPKIEVPGLNIPPKAE